MAIELSELIPFVIIVFVIIAGIWLTVLSYLVLKRLPPREEKEAPKVQEKAPEEPKVEETTGEDTKPGE